jgi:glycosyltransferase involved in cell wall biosynthesis
LGEIMLVAAQSFGITDPRPFGFDAAVEFPPHGITSRTITSEVEGLEPGFRGKIHSYPEIAARNPPCETPYPHFKAVCGAWDNTARRGLSSTIFGRATPQAYQQWLQQVIDFTQRHNAPEHRFVFINAWNEWAEGAHLEPDSTWGYGYLNATARALLACEVSAPRLEMKRQQTTVEEGRVSIIVPAYNHERYIHEALDSIRKQRLAGLKSEVIVVDDGSSDGTAEKVELYKTRYPSFDIRLIRQRNAGAHAAINTGVEASRGSYIAILNSDDQYHPERICLLYEAMEKHGGPLCFSDLEIIDDDSNLVNENDAYVRHIRDNLRRIKTYPSLGYALLTFNSAVSTGNLFFSRDVFDRIGGFKKLRYCHDWDFVLSALEFGAPVRVSNRLYRYRLHASNTFSSLGQMTGHEESRIVLHKAARRILNPSSPDAFPLLTESRKYLLDLLARLGHPLEEQECSKAA